MYLHSPKRSHVHAESLNVFHLITKLSFLSSRQLFPELFIKFRILITLYLEYEDQTEQLIVKRA
jgi:hypothetical protein